jgi:hypothetical protein
VAFIAESGASFRIFGDFPDPALITERLRIEPSKSQPRGSRNRQGFLYKESGWWLESPLPRETHIEEHLRWLLDRLVPVSEGIRELARDGWRIDIFCGLHPKYGDEGFVLDHRLIQDLATIGLHEIGFDIFSPWYRDGDEDEADVAKDQPPDVE